MLSVTVNDGRSRSRSPGGRHRERSTSRDLRAPSPSRRGHSPARDRSPARSTHHSSRKTRDASPSSESSDSDDSSDGSSDSRSEHDRSHRRRKKREDDHRSHRRKDDADRKHRSRKHEHEHEHEKKSSKAHRRSSSSSSERHDHHGRYAYPPQYAYANPSDYARHMSYAEPSKYGSSGAYPGLTEDEIRRVRHMSLESGEYPPGMFPPGFERGPPPPDDPRYAQFMALMEGRSHYAAPGRYEYAQPSHEIKYLNKNDSRHSSYKHKEKSRRSHHHDSSDSDRDKRDRRPRHDSHSDPRFVEVRPSTLVPTTSSRSHRLSVGAAGAGLTAGALSLAAPHAHHGALGAAPPGSPLLEAYRGTYQSISPMPSPMTLPVGAEELPLDLEPLDRDSDSDGAIGRSGTLRSLKKRVLIYDPEPDAVAIADALKHSTPKPGPLIRILPPLSDDNMLALRSEYKKHFKVGGKGINVAKHIKLKVPGNLGKVAYATALGRWESEAHWSNTWFQPGTTRRELLIEALMGRSNPEIRQIKEAFSDKRYGDSLEKCMRTELKKDKFCHAVLLALEARRMDELTPINKLRVRGDVADLYDALTSRDGGETAMIDIIVVRSDTHLREVLREFEIRYKRNFAREMISKSPNLVGETLAHILNGVLNRPVRDALLLHQALAETARDRAELLMSRLVRFHWEPKHLARVKSEYQRRYAARLEDDIQREIKGDFGAFCLALCAGATK